MPAKQQFFEGHAKLDAIFSGIGAPTFSGFSVQMGYSDDKLPIFHSVPVRWW